jgi:hypothetical protein
LKGFDEAGLDGLRGVGVGFGFVGEDSGGHAPCPVKAGDGVGHSFDDSTFDWGDGLVFVDQGGEEFAEFGFGFGVGGEGFGVKTVTEAVGGGCLFAFWSSGTSGFGSVGSGGELEGGGGHEVPDSGWHEVERTWVSEGARCCTCWQIGKKKVCTN